MRADYSTRVGKVQQTGQTRSQMQFGNEENRIRHRRDVYHDQARRRCLAPLFPKLRFGNEIQNLSNQTGQCKVVGATHSRQEFAGS